MRNQLRLAGLCLAVVLTAAVRPTTAAIIVTVDENGNGTIVNTSTAQTSPLPASLAPDLGPGGAPSALTYSLLSPPSLVVGDVFLFEPGQSFVLSDLIRFNPNGTLVFYSDTIGPSDPNPALADSGFPSAFYPNSLNVFEVGNEGLNGLTYTPTEGQPGFVSGFDVTYVIRSDFVVPEPGTFALGCMGAMGLGAVGWRRRATPIA